jgi:Carboxypeptidase regulatory-like domain/TonB dependent receptor
MPRLRYRSAANYFFLWLIFSLVANFTWAQSETATVSGQVVDPSGLNITGAQVKLVDIDRDTAVSVSTNSTGLYTFPSVRPGRYRMEVVAPGFKVVNVTGVTVNVQDHLEQNFKLVVGSISESITVEGGASLVDTESATVSTVVDRNFADNLPMNGRSFQSLIELTPGVVVATSSLSDGGQFNINGQRANANYWMVDGVSANIGVASYSVPGNGLGGTLGSFSALGGTNSLVSVDALQEFRIQTSTYAPEFGRTPGGQISIVTRSGTNQFHGSAFEYLRNDVFDANDWFADEAGLPKPEERQSDFGGTFSGPLFKDRTFFFFSYEGLRLRLPQTALTTVPCDSTCSVAGNVRAAAVPAMQPFLNAFPLPNGAEVFTPCTLAVDPTCPPSGQQSTGSAEFDASYSNPASLDAYSLRIDHRLNNKLSVFGRYNYSPSKIIERGANSSALSELFSSSITTQTATAGTTWVISPVIANDLRFNYSGTGSSSTWYLDNFGNASPLNSLPFPSPYTSQDGPFFFTVLSLTASQYVDGKSSRNQQRQFNVIDNLATQKGSHSLKFGVDYRRLSPVFSPYSYAQAAFFNDVPSAENGNANGGAFVLSGVSVTFLFRNLGVFAQDTWRVAPHLTVTYGLRWDVDFVPSTTTGPNIPAVSGFDLNNLSSLALAPAGTPPFKTTYGNLAPRVGVAYQLWKNQEWGTVVRGGFGVFYDLEDGEVGNLASYGAYPFAAGNFFSSAAFPLAPIGATPPQIAPPNASNQGTLTAFDPTLKLPYTLEWNAALEQGLGTQQNLSASYVGSAGRRLTQSAFVNSPTPNLASAYLVADTAISNYNALQFQFQRRLSHGLQALASYTWSHSIDTGSGGSLYGNPANSLVPGTSANANRGPSDFDIRDALSAGLTYDIPASHVGSVPHKLLGHWSLQSIVQAHSSTPVNVYEATFNQLNQFATEIRPDVVPGQNFYLYGPQYPGGKALNPAAFTSPPIDANGNPLRQGDLGRNALRGFGVTQWDFAVHRDFPIFESLKLQFRAEMFNILNHPNFANPQAGLGYANFGQSTQTLAQSLGGNVGNGGFSPLYQIGGPRSIQLAMRLTF